MYSKYRQTICVQKKNTFQSHCQHHNQLYEDSIMKKLHVLFDHVNFVQIMIVHVRDVFTFMPNKSSQLKAYHDKSLGVYPAQT